MMRKRQSLLTHAGPWLIALALFLGLNALTVSASIIISSFRATPQASAILVEWETATEPNTVGFSLYRALSASGPWDQRINQQQAKGDGNTGAHYEYLDTDVMPGVRYYYLLEELTSSGSGDTAGPINAGIDLRWLIYLPLITR